MIKDKVYKTYYSNLYELIKIFEKGFEEFVRSESLYENWLKDMV